MQKENAAGRGLRLWSVGRVATYYRVSSDEQKLRQTIDAQRRTVLQRLTRDEIDVPGEREFFDDGVSGVSEIGERDGGRALLRAAERREFETLYVFAVDRLGREAYYCLQAFHLLRKMGVRIQSVTEVFDPDEPTGKLVIAFLAGKSESDKQSIYDRTIGGRENMNAEPDLYVGGVVPYGYCLEWASRKRRKYAICDQPIPGAPDWSPRTVIIFIYACCLAGETCPRIAAQLNAAGVPTCWVPGDRRYGLPAGRRWTDSRVDQILKNPFYHGVQRIGDPAKSQKYRREQPFLRTVPAIVTVAEYDRARWQLQQSRRFAGASPQTYLLRGKITCGLCGAHYCGTPTVSAYLPRSRYYRCRNSTRELHCRGKWVLADEVEAMVKADIEHFIRHPDEFVEELREQLGMEATRVAHYLDEAERFDRERKALENRTLEYYRQRAEGLIKQDAILQRLLAEVESDDRTLAEQAQHCREQAQAALQADLQVQRARDVLERYADRIEGDLLEADWLTLIGDLVDAAQVETIGVDRHRKARFAVQYPFRARHAVSVTIGRLMDCMALAA